MTLSYGIDFGTTNSLVSSFDGRSLVSHRNRKDKPHPSVVHFPNDFDKPICGDNALQALNGRPKSMAEEFCRSIKTKMGDKDWSLSVFGELYFPEDIAGLILDFLKHDLSERQPDFPPVKEAVFTVPVRFTSFERKRLSLAASSAGISVKTFVHEPLAAFVGHLARQENLSVIEATGKRRSLVVDWGGGTLDICLIEYGEGRLEQLATECIRDRSGDYFDDLLADYVLLRNADLLEIDPQAQSISPNFIGVFHSEIESCKISLSDRDAVDVFVPSAIRYQDAFLDVDLSVTREEFSSLLQSEIQAALSRAIGLIRKAGFKTSQVDKVLLVGGTSRIPAVSEVFRHEFGLVRVDVSDHADSLIADGAALIGFHEWLPYYSSEYSLRLADGSSYSLIQSGAPMQPELARGNIALVCTDNRNGFASLIVEESQSSRKISSSLLKVPVSTVLRDVFKERVFLEYYTSEYLTLQLNATSSIAGAKVTNEFSDCPFGLRVK